MLKKVFCSVEMKMMYVTLFFVVVGGAVTLFGATDVFANCGADHGKDRAAVQISEKNMASEVAPAEKLADECDAASARESSQCEILDQRSKEQAQEEASMESIPYLERMVLESAAYSK